MSPNVESGRLPRNQADLWTRCQDLVSEGDVDHFVVGLLNYLRSSGGRGRGNLADDLSKCVQHENQSRTLCFLCHCVEHIVKETADHPDANTLAHALLDSIPAVVDVQIVLSQEAYSSGAALFWQLLDPLHCRLAMKLAQGFRFTEQILWEASQFSSDTTQGVPSCCSFQQFEQELSKRLLVLLDSSKSSKPAISMLKQFREIAVKYFQTEEVLCRLVDAKQIDLAIDWAAHSGHDLQVALVKMCIDEGHLKHACNIVKAHNLEKEFPAIATGGVTALRAMDWADARSYVANAEVEEFVDAAIDHFRDTNGAGGQMRKLLEHCFSKETPADAIGFICDCVTHVAEKRESQEAIAVAHAMLDCVPALAASARPVPKAALCKSAAVLWLLFTPTHARLAVKIAQGVDFNEQSLWEATQACVSMEQAPMFASFEDFEGELARRILGFLDSTKTMSPAMITAMQFRSLAAKHLQSEEVIEKLVDAGQTPLATDWAQCCGHQVKVALVERCISQGNLKNAVHCAKRLGLEAEFPHLERLQKEDTLARLCKKQLWPQACRYVEDNPQLQEKLLREMVLVGEAALAHEYAVVNFGVDPAVLQLDPAELAADKAGRAAAYLQLPLPPEAVHFVDSAEGLAEAASLVLEAAAPGEAAVLGLDCEWEACTEKGSSSSQKSVSLLQVASRRHVLLLDMLALHELPELDAFLIRLLATDTIIKTGVGVTEDIAQLARGYPAMQAFKECSGILELGRVFTRSTDAQPGLQPVQKKQGISLSAMAEACLGKPLDKSMQMSRWNRRPLSQRQQTYAALDALAAVLIYDSLAHSDPGFVGRAAAALTGRQETGNGGQEARGKKRALAGTP
ncbi:probable exonuclease mut-7 homolog at C-terminar half [Coccomyxa sp. Obi]|nr:probable exonuclease mut-7 homolog at C-terminar half [Coccomyxa sp. Obi]